VSAAAVAAGDAPKGDVIGTARIAAIQAAKRTDEWIPLCHTLPLNGVDELLVPVIPTTLSSRTLGQLSGFLAAQPGAGTVRVPGVLPYLSMVDRRKRLHRELVDSLRGEWPDMLATMIPAASVIERMGPERAPVATFAPTSPAARAFAELWAEVAGRLWD